MLFGKYQKNFIVRYLISGKDNQLISESFPTPHKQQSRILPCVRRMASSTKNQNIFLYSVHLGAPLSLPPYCGVHGGLFYATICHTTGFFNI